MRGELVQAVEGRSRAEAAAHSGTWASAKLIGNRCKAQLFRCTSIFYKFYKFYKTSIKLL